ncbi:MAG TPA: hypothetical protein VF026_31530 [Ktedonobacteraceae bacterium]
MHQPQSGSQAGGRVIVGARVVDVGVGAAFIAFMVARAGDASVIFRDVSQGNRTRATIKAINAAPNRSAPPSPLRHVMGFSSVDAYERRSIRLVDDLWIPERTNNIK